MSKTFLSFRLKHVIRSCAFVLAVLFVLNGETSRAQSPTFANDTVNLTVCATGTSSLNLGTYLRYNDGVGQTENFTVASGPMGTTVLAGGNGTLSGFPHSETSPASAATPGGATPAGLTYDYVTNISAGTRQFVITITGSTGSDNIVFNITLVNIPPVATIAGAYNEVHVGQSITLTGSNTANAYRSGPSTSSWSFTPAGLTTMTASGSTVTLAGTAQGTGTLTLTETGTCGTSTDTRSITILTNTPPTLTATPGAAMIQGQSYTIGGSGFNTTPGRYSVYFGAAKVAGTITAAPSSITVTVPVGATYAPIYVLDNVSHLSSFIMPSFTPLYDSTHLIGSTYAQVKNPLTFVPSPGFDVAGGTPYSVEYADFDGDGKNDIVVSGSGSSNAIVFRNTSGGQGLVSFASPDSFKTQGAPISTRVADMDGDGKLDIITANAGGRSITILRNTSISGTISFAPKVDVSVPGYLPTELTIGDFNKDGRPDVAVIMGGVRTDDGTYFPLGHTFTTDEMSGRLVVVRNNYNQSINNVMAAADFDTATIHQYDIASAPISVAASDLNADGRADIVVVNHLKRELDVYTNTTSASTTAMPIFATVAHVSTAAGSGTLAATDPTHTPGRSYDYTTFRTGYPNQMKIGDLNGDGKVDLAVAVTDSDLLTSNNYNKVVIFKNNGTGGFSTTDTILLNTDGAAPVGVVLADLSGDNNLDVINSNAGGGTISIFKNRGGGTLGFDAAVTKNTAIGPVCVAVGDLDNNTVFDIAVVTRFSNRLQIFRGYPLPDTTAIIGDSVICSSSTNNRYNSSRGPAAGATAYWSTFGGHISITGVNTNDTVYINAGPTAGTDTLYYNVIRLNDTNTVKYVVRVNATAATPAVLTGADSVCVGSSITLTSNSPGTWAITPASPAATITSGGVVTGLAGGTATVVFTLSGCSSTTTPKTITVSTPLTGAAFPISGPNAVCQGSSISLNASVPTGGSARWRSDNTAVSTVSAPSITGGTSTVTVTGVANGSNNIYYILSNVCGSDSSSKAITVSTTPVAGPLSGSHVMCASSSQTLTGATAGGTWTSSAPGIASVNATTGVVTSGAGTGVADITYTVTGCTTVSDTFRINVSAAPAVGTISGPTHQCAGSFITLTYAGAAGTWSTTSGITASAPTPTSVTITAGATAGYDTVYYTVSSVGCPSVVTKHIDTVISISTITPITSSAGTGADTICINGTVTFSNATSPGTWSLSNTTVATINPTGGSVLVTGLVSGSDTVIYTATGCGTLSTKRPVYVRATPSAGTISGVNSICAAVPGFATLATTGTPGGVWGSSNTSTATVDASGTVVSTSTTAAGANPVHTTNITYSVTTLVCGSGTTDANYSFTVTTAPVVSSITTTLLPGGTTLSDSVCIGAQLRGNATPNAGGVTTAWAVSNTNLAIVGSSTTTPATFNGVTAGSTVITFTATNTCGSGTNTKTIKIKTLPSAGHIVGDTAVCLPRASFQYTDTVGTTTATGGTWSFTGSGIFVVASGPSAGLTDYNSAGPATITYTTANNGCGTASTSINLLVSNAPNAGITSAPSGTSICVGEMDTLTNTEFATGGGYQWYSKDVTIATVNQAGIVTGIGSGSVKIYYIDSTGCGVDSTSFVTITVGGLAPVGVITGQDTACVGGTVQLLNTAVPGGVWSSSAPSIASINATTGLVTAGPNGGTAIITYTTSNGTCPDNDTTFTFRSFAAPNFHSTAPATVCDSQLLSFVGTSDTVGTTFTWTRAAVTGIFNAAASGIDTVREYLDDTTNTAVTATYAFIATAHGCVSNPYNVNVSVTPTPHLTSPLFDTICSGALFVYVAQASTTPASLAWTRPTVAGISNSVGNGTTGTISETLNDTTVASVTVQYIYTVGYGTCPTHTETLTVSVNPSPAVPKIVTHSPSTVCSMTMDQNFGAASTPPAGVIYTWFATGAQVWATGSDRQYSLVNFTEPGDAVVYLLATVPGLSCPAKDSFPVSVSSSVSDQPQVAYFNGDFVCLSSSQDTYQWGYDNRSTLDSSLFTSETNQNMTVENPDFTGKYYFVITTHNGCMQKSYYNAPTGVKNITGSMGDMKVYPNPADQFVNVEINNTAGGKYNVEVVNLLGQKLDAKEMVNNKANLDIANLASGVYMINCYRDGVKFASAKFVKN